MYPKSLECSCRPYPHAGYYASLGLNPPLFGSTCLDAMIFRNDRDSAPSCACREKQPVWLHLQLPSPPSPPIPSPISSPPNRSNEQQCHIMLPRFDFIVCRQCWRMKNGELFFPFFLVQNMGRNSHLKATMCDPLHITMF